MKRRNSFITALAVAALVLAVKAPLWAGEGPGGGLQGTIHDFATGGWSTYNTQTVGECTFCHTPHGAPSSGLLWNHQLSTNTYHEDIPYTTAGTNYPTFADNAWQGPTAKCLSCHDGTVTVGSLNWFNSGYGGANYKQTININPKTAHLQGLVANGTMTGIHPVAMPYPWGGAPSTYNGSTTGGALMPAQWNSPPLGNVRLYEQKGTAVVLGYNGVNGYKDAAISGNAGIECSSCHDPHNKITVDENFLVGKTTGSDNTYLCNLCHVKN